MRDLITTYVRPYRATIIGVTLLGMIASGLSLLQPVAVGNLIDAVQVRTQFIHLVLIVVVVAVVAALLAGLQQLFLGKLGEQTVQHVRISMVRKILHLPLSVYHRRAAGEFSSRIASDPSLLKTFIAGGIVNAIESTTVLFGAVVALVLLDAITFLISISIALVALVITAIASKTVRTIRASIQQSVSDMGANIQRSIASIRVLRAYNAVDVSLTNITRNINGAYHDGIKLNRLFAVILPLAQTLTQIAYASAIVVGGLRVASDLMTLSQFISFLMFFSLVISPINSIIEVILTFQEASAGHSRIRDITKFDTVEDNRDSQLSRSPSPALSPVLVSFKNVSFSYTDARKTLSDVTFQASPGKVTAIVGPSGAGKSTIAHLLVRFIEPQQGEIRINDRNIATMSREETRSMIGFVDQEAAAISGTLKQNLDPAERGYPEDTMRQVLERVSLGGFHERLEHGLNSRIGEGGASVSGGERQRIAIARALIADPLVLLMDEPTSSLDGQSEESITQLLSEISRQTTTIVIAHRLSTIREAHNIIVLKDGQTCGSGPHRTLLADNTTYRQLIRSQLNPLGL